MMRMQEKWANTASQSVISGGGRPGSRVSQGRHANPQLVNSAIQKDLQKERANLAKKVPLVKDKISEENSIRESQRSTKMRKSRSESSR